MNLTVLRIVHLALMASVAVYGGIIHTLPPPEGAAPAGAIAPIMLAMGIAIAVAALFVRFKIAATAPADRAFAFYILSFALAESPGVFGLVVHFLGGAREMSFGLVFLSLIVLFLCYPRQ